MKLLKNDNSFLELNPISYKQNILINYDHQPTTGGLLRSIDRGIQTDRYETEMVFKGSKEYISEILTEINLLRLNNKKLRFSECEEGFWGEHLDYQFPQDCVISDIDIQNNTSWNVQTIKIKLLLNFPVFLTDIAYPFPLQCMQHVWSGGNLWNTTISETYQRDIYFTDHQNDEYTFTGKFMMNNLQLTKFYNWYRTVARGETFTITDSDLGVANPFGATITETSHDVVILEAEYERVSPILKLVTINLRRIND